jgi:hypothetical protein
MHFRPTAKLFAVARAQARDPAQDLLILGT